MNLEVKNISCPKCGSTIHVDVMETDEKGIPTKTGFTVCCKPMENISIACELSYDEQLDLDNRVYRHLKNDLFNLT